MASSIVVLRFHRCPRSSQSVSHLSPAPRICVCFSRGVFGYAVPALLSLLRRVPAAFAAGSSLRVVEGGGAFVRSRCRFSWVADWGSALSTGGSPRGGQSQL